MRKAKPEAVKKAKKPDHSGNSPYKGTIASQIGKLRCDTGEIMYGRPVIILIKPAQESIKREKYPRLRILETVTH